ncbi:hypothetical protein [Caldilinea sp.]|jgi:hypothetical protein|uniref:hypothetical protein n=1 Tax=Caldilinea sp. TaxID=2293560 RepID=UPI00257B2E30|nr:hypothetical protein [Caldilinea sp.]
MCLILCGLHPITLWNGPIVERVAMATLRPRLLLLALVLEVERRIVSPLCCYEKKRS